MRCAGHVEDPRRCEKEWHRCDTLGYQSTTGDGDSNLQQLQVGGEGMERFENTSGSMKFQKNFMYQAWSIEKIHQPVRFRCCFFGGSKKNAWILSRFWNAFQHGNCFLLNDDTHLTKAGGIVCCWWKGIGIVLRCSKWSFPWFAWFWGKCMWL